MVVLVIGGSGSGKSAYAEQRAVELAGKRGGRLLYLATMEIYDEESLRRIERHRDMRKDKNFLTIECQTHLEEVAIFPGDTVLLECMSNLTANEMFGISGRGKEEAQGAIWQGIKRLAEHAAHLVIVGNNIFEEVMMYDSETTDYIRQLAQLQNRAASLADEVVEVLCKIPVFIKGGEKKL